MFTTKDATDPYSAFVQSGKSAPFSEQTKAWNQGAGLAGGSRDGFELSLRQGLAWISICRAWINIEASTKQ
jgi:hypothetical protein